MNLVGENHKRVKQSMFSDAVVLFWYDLGNLTVCVLAIYWFGIIIIHVFV